MREISDEERAAKTLGWEPGYGERVWVQIPGEHFPKAGWATGLDSAWRTKRVRLKMVKEISGDHTADAPLAWVYPRMEKTNDV